HHCAGVDEPPAIKPNWNHPTPWGGRPIRPQRSRRVMFWIMRHVFRQGMTVPVPSRRVAHGEALKLAGREVFAVHTPGHTLDHLCLHDPEEGLLFSGDHVLPTITPHISGVGTGEDPLKAFVGSLDAVAAIDGVRQVLPAHGHPFADLPGRVDDIKLHHEQRIERLKGAAADIGGPASVRELSQHLFRPQRWGPMAESETYAHLEHLRHLGEATRHERDGQLFYELG
ncbi:MAG: MBL fold metallo-hydrolase, partial [Actinobacteria bacterium]|nr:MBL fold metallo-hydrolase [Actinomycetota bacterium]